jgi:hypothetical protein
MALGRTGVLAGRLTDIVKREDRSGKPLIRAIPKIGEARASRSGWISKKKLVFTRLVRRATGGLVSPSSMDVRAERTGIDNESDQVKEGHSVDALALRGDEGRGTLR